MKRLEGGYLGGRPTWSLASNPGIWGIEQVFARRVAGTWPAGGGSFDEYYEYVTFMLHADGANASTSFPDSSLLGNAVAVNGNAKVSTTQSKFGGSSISLDGSGDYLVASSSSAFALQAGDWTIEFWIYFNALSGSQNIIDFRTTSGSAVCPTIYTSGTSLLLAVGSSNVITPADVLITGFWYHIAVAKSAGSTRMFLNGTQVGSTYADSNLYVNNSSLNIGRYPVSNVSFLNGYIDELRITKGYARYTSNFSVPTAPYEDEGAPLADPFHSNVSLLLPMNGSNNSTTFTDKSPNALTVTANGDAKLSTAVKRYGVSSAAFDGTGDYLQIPDATALELGSGDYTIEAWVKTSSSTQYATILSRMNGAFLDGSVSLLINNSSATSGEVAFWVQNHSNAGPMMTTSGVNIRDDTWHHIAIVRSGTSHALYVDGTSRATATASYTISNIGNAWSIGSDLVYAARALLGYIDDLRITKGVARYLGNFIPPLPHADYGTLADPYLAASTLWMPMEGPVNSTGFFDRADRLPVTTYGNAKISNAQYKWGLTSALFDGAGDYVTIQDSDGLNFGSGDFTIEMWVYSTAANPNGAYLYSKRTSNIFASVVILFANSTLRLVASGDGSTWGVDFTSTIGIAQNRWTHVAFTRNGSSWRMFFDGNQVGAQISSVTPTTTTAPVVIGADNSGGTGGFFAGHIDDLRIIKGHARYTTNFTPPTAPINADTSSDPYLSNVSLLLKMDGANNSTAFTDSSLTPKTVFANGDAKISTAQSKFGGSSALFDGTGDYLEIPRSSDFTFGTGNFTVEFWLRVTAVPAGLTLLLDFRSAGADVAPALYLATTTRELTYFTNNANRIVGSSVPLATWVHVALSRSAANTRLFVDGLQVGSTYSDANNYVSSALIVGAGFNYADSLNGYIDDLRITKGVARYTANFIPPTISHPVWSETDASFSSVSLLLNGNGSNASTTIADRSSNGLTLVPNGNAQISTTQSRFGGSSLYFDGSGDYLSVAANSVFEFGASSFTWEAWVYINSLSAVNGLYYYGSGNSNRLQISVLTDGSFQAYMETASGFIDLLSSASAVTANTWTHLAVSRDGNTWRSFVNGIVAATATSSLVAPAGQSPNIGFAVTSSINRYCNGYIDDLRITKGVARYTTTFTPPVAPLPIPVIDPYFGAVSLLLHMNGANASTTFPDHSYNALAVTANGNAQISTAQSKFGGASALFDGTGDWLSVSTNTVLNLAGVNFTIEAWIYISGLFTANIDGNRVGTILAYGSTTTNQGYELIINQTGNTFALQSNGTANGAFASYTFNTNQWYHVAATRSGSVSQLFVDGQALTLSTNTFPNNSSSNGTLKIGAERLYTGYNHDFNGYIDELRITKGYARYTANFTPPATQFPNS